MHWIGLVCVVGCSAEPEVPARDPHKPIDGVEEVSEPLSDLSAQCAFNATSKVVTLTLNAGDLAVISRGSDGAITINDFACSTATATTIRRIDVSEGSAGDQTLIIDYGRGLFAPGVSGSAGIAIALGGQTSGDSLRVIGTPTADNFVLGAAGLAINSDGFVDVTITGVEDYLISLDDGDDVFSAAGNTASGAAFAVPVTVYGGAGNDAIRGGAAGDALNGGAGNDTFTTGAMPDGGDAMNGGAGSDTVDYSPRTQAVTVTIDDVADDGGASEADNVAIDVEAAKGGMADDQITGGAGAETLSGGPGNDAITGGDGNDTLNGDAGNDTFDEGGATSGSDTISGGAGIDTVSYASRTGQVTALIDAIAHSGESGELDKIALDVENLTGGSGNDSLTGSMLDNLIDGGGGGDIVAGGAGNDTLRGGPGDDTLRGEAGDDVFDEGAAPSGADTMYGGAGTDRVNYAARTGDLVVTMDTPLSGPGGTPSGEASEADLIAVDIENLVGGSGADSLTGNATDNQIEGGSGTAIDTLNGLAGDDLIDGGSGADIIDCGSGDADINLDVSTGSLSNCEL